MDIETVVSASITSLTTTTTTTTTNTTTTVLRVYYGDSVEWFLPMVLNWENISEDSRCWNAKLGFNRLFDWTSSRN